MPALDPTIIPSAAREVHAELKRAGFESYFVGGCVRDMLRGKTPKDFDLTTSARPEQVQALFKKVIPTGLQHGTVTVRLHGTSVEVTTFRSEGAYVDGRRPTSVTFETDVVEDLSRRDFTINAIAYDPQTGALVDPFDGQTALGDRVIRCVGRAFDRFSEDGLRALRAVRFAAVLGFEIDPETLAAIPPTLPVFAKVSKERIHDELVKLLLSENVATGLALLESTGLLGVFWPALVGQVRGAAVARARAEETVRLAVLLEPRGPAAARDHLFTLKFSVKTCDRTAHLIAHSDWAARSGNDDPTLRVHLAQLGAADVDDSFDVALALADFSAAGEIGKIRDRVHQLLASKPALSVRDLALDGRAVMQFLAAPPGPIVGEATRFLMQEVLRDPTLNEPQKLAQLLRAWRPSSKV